MRGARVQRGWRPAHIYRKKKIGADRLHTSPGLGRRSTGRERRGWLRPPETEGNASEPTSFSSLRSRVPCVPVRLMHCPVTYSKVSK